VLLELNRFIAVLEGRDNKEWIIEKWIKERIRERERYTVTRGREN
jgi:hypothetical protein